MRIVDLFSGAGGLTFGFYYRLKNNSFVRNENCEIVFANEFDANAAKAFSINFPNVNMIQDSVVNLDGESIRNLIGNKPIDIVIGGPPCQSFSTIGKRVYDDKAKLYNEYLRLLKIIRPRVFLFENVKGMLSMRQQIAVIDENGIQKLDSENKPIFQKGTLIIDDIKERFAQIEKNFGYKIFFDVLDAANFGVPQHRERVFIIGVRNDLNMNWTFPKGNQNVMLSIENAISDVPPLGNGERNERYNCPPLNIYQSLMRGNCTNLTHHFAGHYGDKIQTIMNNVIQGEGKNYINKLVDEGILQEKYRLTSGYNNTYGRLVANQPSTTITNNLATPSGLRCIHYAQNRALSPREGARIQSFPDWFQFYGKKVHVTTQIGNAVPPLLAMALARKLEGIIK